MSIRRVKHADNESWKAATRVKKSKAKQIEKKRNITHNELGQMVGKAYIHHQDFGTLALKKAKRNKISENDQEETGENEEAAQQNSE
mmetsp:Transcript_25047/g.27770  ORF Transcript_25047/g.27770 Transcript_25047/m.27770 type:complete len:87 (+) Transcript_25047:777-1037(+)